MRAAVPFSPPSPAFISSFLPHHFLPPFSSFLPPRGAAHDSQRWRCLPWRPLPSSVTQSSSRGIVLVCPASESLTSAADYPRETVSYSFSAATWRIWKDCSFSMEDGHWGIISHNYPAKYHHILRLFSNLAVNLIKISNRNILLLRSGCFSLKNPSKCIMGGLEKRRDNMFLSHQH